MQPIVLAFGIPGGWEWIAIVVVALLIFGRRLPDVARSVGKSIVEFKKGIREVNTEIDTQSRLDSAKPDRIEQQGASTSPSATSSQASPVPGGTVQDAPKDSEVPSGK